MLYVVSDIHGHYDKYVNMLRAINFGDSDTLYVLGDVIDRGENGFKILLVIMKRPNVVMIKGNHEVMAIDALKGFIANDKDRFFLEKPNSDLELWLYNSGHTSLNEFMALTEEQMDKVWNYLINLPLYIELTVNDKQYILLHAGLMHFNKKKKLSDYTVDEIVWARPETGLRTEYFPDKIVIAGHTPTPVLGTCEYYDPKISKASGYIDIDCGCAYGDL